MKKTAMWAGCLAAGVMAFQAMAAPMITQGTRQLSVGGSLDDDGEDIGIALSGSGGYFIMDGIEVGAGLRLAMRGDWKTAGASVFGEYNVDMGTQVVPYAGASIGLNWSDSDWGSDSYLELTGYAGAKYFLVDSLAIGAQAELMFATEDVYNGGEDAMDWALRVVTAFYW